VDEGEPIDSTAPKEDEALVPDPQEEPPGSPQVGMPELDPPQSERGHSPSPSWNELDDDGNPQRMPDPEHGNEDGQQCYGQLAVMSDVDDGGVCPECQQQKEVLLCYNEASTTERC
jgi:rubredoxin